MSNKLDRRKIFQVTRKIASVTENGKPGKTVIAISFPETRKNNSSHANATGKKKRAWKKKRGKGQERVPRLRPLRSTTSHGDRM